jgi:DNA-binding winged helix-turn-helix (wHTH) protein
MRATFGDLAIDSDRREVLMRGAAVRLSPKAYALLRHLIERRPAAVSRRELYDVLWPNLFVSNSNLPTLAAEIRRALEDDAKEPRFIRTLFGFGYAFIAEPLLLVDQPPVSRLSGDGVDLLLPSGATVLGRAMPQLAHIGLVSREHALVTISAEGATIEDLGSKNGTFVGGRRTHGATAIVDGDVILLGKLRMTFRRLADPATTLTAP